MKNITTINTTDYTTAKIENLFINLGFNANIQIDGLNKTVSFNSTAAEAAAFHHYNDDIINKIRSLGFTFLYNTIG